MDVIVFIIVIIATILAIASGLWVASALGKAISPNKENNVPEDSASDLTEK
jgi:hypothetical protein